MIELLIAAIAAIVGFAAGIAIVRRRAHRLVEETKRVVRDTSRRVPPSNASSRDELRELGEWINFLAEDADKGHRALAHERVLLSTVADGLTQGVIALDGDQRIELLNDAARTMLGVTSSPLGESLVEFVRVPELRELIAGDLGDTAEIQLPMGPRTLVRVERTYGSEGCVLLLEDVTEIRRLETCAGTSSRTSRTSCARRSR